MSIPPTTIDGNRGTPGRLIKVDHAGEFGAVNIYRGQILVARLSAPSIVHQLQHFLEHEKGHLQTFGVILAKRGIRRCRSFWFCGVGGFCLGVLTAMLGKPGIMACTAAVETVVTGHLVEQLSFMEAQGDLEAHAAVSSIVAEELEHQEAGIAQGQHSFLYRPLCFVISRATEFVIWSGLRL